MLLILFRHGAGFWRGPGNNYFTPSGGLVAGEKTIRWVRFVSFMVFSD
jgi:hypothetical protein